MFLFQHLLPEAFLSGKPELVTVRVGVPWAGTTHPRHVEDLTLSLREPKCHFLHETQGNTWLLWAPHTFIPSHCCWLSLQGVFIPTKNQFLFLFNHRLKVTTYLMLGSPHGTWLGPRRVLLTRLRPRKDQTQLSKTTDRGVAPPQVTLTAHASRAPSTLPTNPSDSTAPVRRQH